MLLASPGASFPPHVFVYYDESATTILFALSSLTRRCSVKFLVVLCSILQGLIRLELRSFGELGLRIRSFGYEFLPSQ